MKEWVDFVEAWIDHCGDTPSTYRQNARAVLEDCVSCNELTHYQAHLILMSFFDGRGYN